MKIRVQMPRGTSCVSVGGESYTPDEEGIVHLSSPEHIAPLVANGGIELNEDGSPGQISSLIGSDVFPATIDLGHGQDEVQLGTIVAECQAKSGVSVDEWNNLPQPIRDALIGILIGYRRGDIITNGAEDPRVAELAARVAELEGTVVELTAQIDAGSAGQDTQDTGKDAPTSAPVERPVFADMTKALINEWLVRSGAEALAAGNHQTFVEAANARFDALQAAE